MAWLIEFFIIYKKKKKKLGNGNVRGETLNYKMVATDDF